MLAESVQQKTTQTGAKPTHPHPHLALASSVGQAVERQAGEQQAGTHDHTLLESHVLDKHQQHLRARGHHVVGETSAACAAAAAAAAAADKKAGGACVANSTHQGYAF
jgi:hypothetical protein